MSVTVGPPQPSTVMGVTITPHPVGVGQTATIPVTGMNPCTMLWMDFGEGDWWIAPITSLPFTTTHTWAAAGTYPVLARGYVTCGGEVTRPVTVGSAPEPEALVAIDVSSRDAWALDGDEPWAYLLEAGPWVPSDEPMFAPQTTVPLTVDLAGTGSGTVTSSPGGLVCAGTDGQTCSRSFATGTTVTLAATPDAGSTFAGWGGACSGAGACTVPLASARLVVATFTVPPPWVTQYYHTDALGSVRAVTDTAGAVVRTHDYHPFGEGVGVSAGTDPVRFTGKPRDPETGLDYFGARYYAQGAGRFTTVDPVYTWRENLVDPQRWNRYAYVRNNPIRYTDPDGRCIDGCVLEAAAFVVAAKITADVAIYLQSPQGQQQMRDVVEGTGRLITTAVEGIRSLFVESRRANDFSPSTKKEIDRRNAEKYGGKNVCENCGIETAPGKKSERGVRPPGNERHRDHVDPASKGGSRDASNGQILCGDCNIKKGDTPVEKK